MRPTEQTWSLHPGPSVSGLDPKDDRGVDGPSHGVMLMHLIFPVSGIVKLMAVDNPT